MLAKYFPRHEFWYLEDIGIHRCQNSHHCQYSHRYQYNRHIQDVALVPVVSIFLLLQIQALPLLKSRLSQQQYI